MASNWPYLQAPIAWSQRANHAESIEFEYRLFRYAHFKAHPDDRATLHSLIKEYCKGPKTLKQRAFIKQEFEKGNLDRAGTFATALVDGDTIPLGNTNEFDTFIWDMFVRKGFRCFQTLTYFTSYVQANYVLMSIRPGDPRELWCSFLQRPYSMSSTLATDVRNVHFIQAVRACPSTSNWKNHDVSELVWWNQFLVEDSATPLNTIMFRRCFVVIRHKCRQLFNNLPMLADCLDSSDFDIVVRSFDDRSDEACTRSALTFYGTFAKKDKCWVAGVGRPMQHNLDQLGNAISNDKARVTLVTGLPGTGKENYMRALHFAGTGCDEQAKKRLVTTTALTMERANDGPLGAFKKQCEGCTGGKTITYVIDELNKAAEQTRSELLRILENPTDAIGEDGYDVRFIMAASDHLERLARDPPQDFWTRIANQMHVAHPLGRVSESDARDFLSSFFWSEWYGLAKRWLGENENDRSTDLARQVLGTALVDDGPTDPEDLAHLVCEEFVGTVAPAAMRDEISIRGLRSMLQQIFSNVIWSTRYGVVPSDFALRSWKERTRRSVNHAVQDVLAILNASRSTLRTSAGSDTSAATSSM